MSKKTAVLSLGYWFSASTLGLLQHPYKTVRDIVRKPALSFSILSPLVWFLFFYSLAILIILTFRFIGISLSFTYPDLIYNLVEFVFWWTTTFLLFWQLLIGYLYIRFKSLKY